MSKFIELHSYDSEGELSPFLVRLDSITYIEGTLEGHCLICCNTREAWTSINESYEEMVTLINKAEEDSLTIGSEPSITKKELREILSKKKEWAPAGDGNWRNGYSCCAMDLIYEVCDDY